MSGAPAGRTPALERSQRGLRRAVAKEESLLWGVPTPAQRASVHTEAHFIHLFFSSFFCSKLTWGEVEGTLEKARSLMERKKGLADGEELS